MFCYQCGAQLEEKSAFCPKCGSKIPEADKAREMGASNSTAQDYQKDALSKSLYHENDTVYVQEIKSVKGSQDNEDDFKEFVNNHVQKNTQFRSAEELLNSKVPSRFIQICYGIPAIFFAYNMIVYIRATGFSNGIVSNILVCSFLAFIFGYVAVHMVGGIMKNKYASNFTGKVGGHIETDDLIQFLNEKLAYLSPYFHKWDYLNERVSLNISRVSVAEMDITSSSHIELATEFGEKQSHFSIIVIRPDYANPDSGQRKYICNVKMRKADIGCEKYACIVKTAPILQAAMEYYLKES